MVELDDIQFRDLEIVGVYLNKFDKNIIYYDTVFISNELYDEMTSVYIV